MKVAFSMVKKAISCPSKDIIDKGKGLFATVLVASPVLASPILVPIIPDKTKVLANDLATLTLPGFLKTANENCVNSNVGLLCSNGPVLLKKHASSAPVLAPILTPVSTLNAPAAPDKALPKVSFEHTEALNFKKAVLGKQHPNTSSANANSVKVNPIPNLTFMHGANKDENGNIVISPPLDFLKNTRSK